MTLTSVLFTYVHNELDLSNPVQSSKIGNLLVSQWIKTDPGPNTDGLATVQQDICSQMLQPPCGLNRVRARNHISGRGMQAKGEQQFTTVPATGSRAVTVPPSGNTQCFSNECRDALFTWMSFHDSGTPASRTPVRDYAVEDITTTPVFRAGIHQRGPSPDPFSGISHGVNTSRRCGSFRLWRG